MNREQKMTPDNAASSFADAVLDGDLATLVRSVVDRKVSALALAQASFRRIERLDDQLHAFCTLDKEGALNQAAEVDKRLAAGQDAGPLAGVPVAIKDLICTRGLRTTFGSRLYADFVPDEDDVVTERLRTAGAVIVGKTNTSEFGYGAVGHNPLFPTTRNPWNLDLTPGGSSAGSAAAVVSRMVPLALGSDGGGSVRIPASLTGLFGIKPSWGRVPVYPGCRDERYPGISSWESLEHIGPITRCVADAALAMSVLAGPTPRDRYSLPEDSTEWRVPTPASVRQRRVACSADMGFAIVDPEVRAIFAAAISQLSAMFEHPPVDDCPATGNTQAMFEALVAMDTDRSGLRAMAASQGVPLQGWLRSLIDREWTGDEFTEAIMARKRVVNQNWRFFERYDFLLTPTTATAAFPIDLDGPSSIDGQSVAPTAWLAFSALANLTGSPAASVPIGRTQDGRPVGMQITGRHLDDCGVLALAGLIETMFPQPLWPDNVDMPKR